MSDYATYSPDDNKLRLYPAARLDAATYARVGRFEIRGIVVFPLFFTPFRFVPFLCHRGELLP
jgi:hypothetical protein